MTIIMWVTQCVLVGLLLAVTTASIDLNSPLESDNIIETVNNAKTTWTAGRNFHSSMTKGQIKNLLGARRSPGGSRLPKYVPSEDVLENGKLPTNFDARTKWSSCTGLQTLRDQGPCGSCWAVASAAAFTDRLCIASNGKWNGQLSAQYLMTCCSECGMGCNGGEPDIAWEFFQDTGLCTGGDYNSKEGCQPYTKPACEHHVSGSRKDCASWKKETTPACKKKCYNKSYKTPFAQDFHKVSSTFVSGSVNDAMKEIYTNGPLVAAFDVYEDFVSYKSGVYQHTTGEFLGGHAVKVIGWGVESGTKYWLVANNWNNDWGDKGLFKIIRGTNECSFESDLSGGMAIAPSS